MRRDLCAAAALVTLLPAVSVAAKPEPKTKVTYQYSRHGNPDIAVSPSPMVVLSGGGTDVDEAFRAMCLANNGGDILVLGTATFNKNYYSYIRNNCLDAGKPANSVAILIVPDGEAADQPFVYDTVVAAETVWIAGGDQSNYTNFWKGRKLQQALAERITRGVVIGGISAGLNILTEFVFTAQGSTAITSSFALANPDSPEITLDRDFVKLDPVKGLIGDAHFVTRDRMGRDLTFLYRIDQQWPHERVRGVSVDEGTAVVISGITGEWSAKIDGAGNAYFLEPVDLPRTLPAGSPLDGVTVNVFRIGPGGEFGISRYPWAGTPYRVTVTKGLVQSDPPGQPIY